LSLNKSNHRTTNIKASDDILQSNKVNRDINFSITSVADCMLSATKNDSFESNRYHFHALCVSAFVPEADFFYFITAVQPCNTFGRKAMKLLFEFSKEQYFSLSFSKFKNSHRSKI
jgi:hypothetical protein